MIIKTWSKKVIIIPYDCQLKLGKGYVPPGKKMQQYALAPSELALVLEYYKNTRGEKVFFLKVFCNYDVVPRQMDMMVKYALSQRDDEFRPELRVEECPNFNLLYRLDSYAQIYNETL
jgi:hypothetical protein